MSRPVLGAIVQGGVIAAGQGQRLRSGGWRGGKAMAPVAGRPLIDHTLDRLRAAGVGRLTVIVNEESPELVQRLEACAGFDLALIVRTTPSSYASFCVVTDALADGPAVITTVDTVMPTDGFLRFLDAASRLPADAVVLGVTDQVDDESPLWATVDPADGRVLELGAASGTHVTAGLYVLPGRRPPRPPAGCDRLRTYLGWLLSSGWPVFAIAVEGVFDIDRPHDITQAESALQGA